MKGKYFLFYILSYFQEDKRVRESQIFHILRGKRTPSMFYMTEMNKWHHGFSNEPRIEREQLKRLLNRLETADLITPKEKGYLLTKKGKESVQAYFQKHYFPQKIKSFSNLHIHHSFWNRVQLFTQVFSETSYQNNSYIPIIKDPIHQERVRQLFQEVNGKIHLVLSQWIEEQQVILKELESKKATVLANFLTGHQILGKTRIQIAKELGMSLDELKVYLRDLLEEVIEKIKAQKKQLPLHYEIIRQINEENFLGLSQSTYQTYQMLSHGLGIEQIANERQIKENTVKEHILEIAFIFDAFPVSEFVSQEMYADLSKQFEQDKAFTFKKAVLKNEELEFYHYRLVELERMRNH